MGQEVVTISEVGTLISMLALVSEQGQVRPLEVVLRLLNVGYLDVKKGLPLAVDRQIEWQN